MLCTTAYAGVEWGSAKVPVGEDYTLRATCDVAYLFNTNNATQPDETGVNDGTVVNATFTSSGKYGGAYSFDGSTAYITVANESNFDYALTDPWTFVAWIYHTDTGNNQRAILAKGIEGAQLVGWDFAITNEDGGANDKQIMTHIISDWGGNDRIQVKGSTTDLDGSAWYHVAFSYSGSETSAGVQFYFNGVLETHTEMLDQFEGGEDIRTNHPVYIGKRANNTLYWQGNLDEIGMFSEVLTITEINEIMDRGLRGSIQ